MRFVPAYVVIFVFAVILGTISRNSLADVGSGSAIHEGTTGSAAGAPSPSPSLHDPLTDPGATITDLEAAKRTGWVALAFAILVIASRLLGKVGKNVKVLAWLGKGKWAVVVGAVGALALAAYNALASGGSYYAMLGALAIAAAALHDPNATEEPAPGSSTAPAKTA